MTRPFSRPSAWLAVITVVITTNHSYAQTYGNEWLAYINATQDRLGLDPLAISSLNTEVDFAAGDLDLDGAIDLVIVRKQPLVTPGKRTNLLMMNRGGTLTDETSLYAQSSDVPGDLGFLTPTNDRDVVLTDVDGDGYLDVVTATAVSFGEPKQISHPRVYRNLGASGGAWQGLKHEDARFPQLFTVGGLAVGTNFCGVSAGDVTNDGLDDLFFDDYDAGGGSGLNDLNDRLLINDGFGYFSDESALRMTPAMLYAGFGTSSVIVDVNQDGANDVLKTWSNNTRAIYNNPSNQGHFTFFNTPYDGLSYHVSAGDLNNDGRIDLAVTDDAKDRVVYNLGNDMFGGVSWSSAHPFTFLTGGDEGFGGNNVIADLDNDGWNDVLVADFDDEIPGCFRRLHIYHNPGGAVGSEISFVEEREREIGGWVGAKNLIAHDLNGTYDVAVFDIDGDGGLDLVIGRCEGTYVFTHATTSQPDLGFGGPGVARLTVSGTPLSTGNSATMLLYDAPPTTPAFLFAGVTNLPTFVPEVGGFLVPVPPLLVLALQTDADGTLSIPNIPGGGGPFSIFIQFVIPDATQIKGYTVSNAVEVKIL